MSGYDALAAFVDGVESLRTMNEQVAKAAEKAVLAAARSTASKGLAPDGTKWPELADGGGQPLKGAAEAITSEHRGVRVVIKLGPPWVYHQHGAGGTSTTKDAVRARERSSAKRAKSGVSSKFHAPKRQIIPLQKDPIPDGVRAAIVDAAESVFGKAMGT